MSLWLGRDRRDVVAHAEPSRQARAMTLSISFEVFPPKSADGLDGLRSTVSQLSDVGPAFVSVTYGAGGSDRERSFAAIDAVRAEGFDVAGHLTCVGQARSDVDVVIDRYAAARSEPRSLPCVATRPAGVDAAYNRTPRATSALPISSAPSSSEATSVLRSRPIPRVTRSRRPTITTSTCSPRRSLPAPTRR